MTARGGKFGSIGCPKVLREIVEVTGLDVPNEEAGAIPACSCHPLARAVLNVHVVALAE